MPSTSTTIKHCKKNADHCQRPLKMGRTGWVLRREYWNLSCHPIQFSQHHWLTFWLTKHGSQSRCLREWRTKLQTWQIIGYLWLVFLDCPQSWSIYVLYTCFSVDNQAWELFCSSLDEVFLLDMYRFSFFNSGKVSDHIYKYFCHLMNI